MQFMSRRLWMKKVEVRFRKSKLVIGYWMLRMVLCLNLKELMSICCLVDFGHFMSPLTNYDIQVP